MNQLDSHSSHYLKKSEYILKMNQKMNDMIDKTYQQ